MLGFDYMRRHNRVVRCVHFLLLKRLDLKKSNNIRSHSVQEVMSNDNAEICVYTRIITDIRVKHNMPDIFVMDKERKEIIIVEDDINEDLLTVVLKLRNYNLLDNEF